MNPMRLRIPFWFWIWFGIAALVAGVIVVSASVLFAATALSLAALASLNSWMQKLRPRKPSPRVPVIIEGQYTKEP